MLEPLQNEFMQRAIAEATLIGIAGAAIGCWVVLYRLSWAAEALAHSMLPGLVLATLAGVPLLLGGVPAIALAALAIVAVARIPGLSRDVAVGAVVTTLFGVGVLLALSPDAPPGLQGLLFGDILAVSDGDLAAAAALALLVVFGLALAYPRLLAVGFDPGAARSLGISPGSVEAVLMILLAAGVVVAVQGLGNLLVVAVFVGPAAAARQLTERMVPMLLLAVAVAIASGVAGLYASYYLGTAGGASIALAVLVAYLVSLLAGGLRGSMSVNGRSRPEATITY